MPTFDPDIAKIAGRHLIDSRDIDARSGLLARKVTPVSCSDRPGRLQQP